MVVRPVLYAGKGYPLLEAKRKAGIFRAVFKERFVSL
jgi:hypothetical protein